VTSTKEKKKFNFFSPCHFHKEKKQFKDNFYINIHELININISCDGHPNTFVYASGGPRPVRRDWWVHLVGIALKKNSP